MNSSLQSASREYTGSVLIGVVGPEDENGACRDSIIQIQRRAGDEVPQMVRATKGYEARQHLFDLFEKTQHDFLLLLDHDQVYPADTLERLRAHKLPYLSGYYLRRTNQPILPVWYELGEEGRWPMSPWTKEPERGKLHPLGASGWGCILVHREVVGAVKRLLKGEDLVIEDDLDVWPYDLGRVMEAVHGIGALLEEMPKVPTLKAALAHYHQALEAEIRPLRCRKDMVGSDLRFPFFARAAGYVLMGDPDVRIGHMLNYPLTPDDFSQLPESYREQVRAFQEQGVASEMAMIEKLRKEMAAAEELPFPPKPARETL